MTIERKLRPLRIEPQIIATRYRSGTASPPALIVAGPTASGKSALAMELAERCCGTIINADAMQVYRELRVLTARPSIERGTRVPHALYGIRSAAEPGSVAWWRGAALAEMDRGVGSRATADPDWWHRPLLRRIDRRVWRPFPTPVLPRGTKRGAC